MGTPFGLCGKGEGEGDGLLGTLVTRSVGFVSRGGPLSWSGRFLLKTRLVMGYTPRAVSNGRTGIATSRPLRDPARLRVSLPGIRTVSRYLTRPRGLKRVRIAQVAR